MWTLLRTITSPGRCSLLELQAGFARWESCVSRCEKTLKDKLDDEMKLAGLEALMLEELEKHLILNWNRLRTFEGARLEIVTFFEAKFGYHLIPWVLMLSILCHPVKETGHRVHEIVVSSAVEHTFNVTEMHAKATASSCLARVNRASHGPRVMAKERGKKVRVTSKGKSKGAKGAKCSYKGQTSKTGLSGRKNPKSETSSETQESAQTYPTDNSDTDTSWCDDG